MVGRFPVSCVSTRSIVLAPHYGLGIKQENVRCNVGATTWEGSEVLAKKVESGHIVCGRSHVHEACCHSDGFQNHVAATAYCGGGA